MEHIQDIGHVETSREEALNYSVKMEPTPYIILLVTCMQGFMRCIPWDTSEINECNDSIHKNKAE